MGFESKKEEKITPQKVERSFGDMYIPATQLPTLKCIKMGIWGVPKIGKTHFALTFPKGEIFVIDTEGSTKVNIQQFPEEVKERVHIAEILKMAEQEDRGVDLTQAIDALEDVLQKTLVHIDASGKDPSDFTILIDSATDIWDWLADWLDTDPGTKHIAGGEKINRLEWGKANKRYRDIFHQIRKADCNVILTFVSKEMVDEQGRDLGVQRPRWQKNTFRWLDMIVKLDKVDGKRVMLFKGQDRGGRLGDNIPDLVDPDFPKFFKHLEKHSGVKFK
jgi:hypothetical protein